MLCMIPSPIAMLTSDAPPWVTNGSGMPVIGRSEDHPHVHDDLEQDHRRHPGREHRAERVLRPPAADEEAPDQQPEQDEQHDRAEEAELLREDREHEVGGLDGQVVTLPCVPLVRPLPIQPPDPTAICAW